MHGVLIRESDKNCLPGEYILKQQVDSKTNVEALIGKLVFGNSLAERKSFYFPYAQQAMKVESVFLSCLAVIVGSVVDVITFPYRAFQIQQYKTELKETLPIYKYLKEQNVAQKYLDQDRFEVTFYFDPQTTEKAYIKDTIQGNRYNSYLIDIYRGVTDQRRGGDEEKAEALRKELQRPFVARA